jgi:hypothetical protein
MIGSASRLGPATAADPRSPIIQSRPKQEMRAVDPAAGEERHRLEMYGRSVLRAGRVE